MNLSIKGSFTSSLAGGEDGGRDWWGWVVGGGKATTPSGKKVFAFFFCSRPHVMMRWWVKYAWRCWRFYSAAVAVNRIFVVVVFIIAKHFSSRRGIWAICLTLADGSVQFSFGVEHLSTSQTAEPLRLWGRWRDYDLSAKRGRLSHDNHETKRSRLTLEPNIRRWRERQRTHSLSEVETLAFDFLSRQKPICAKNCNTFHLSQHAGRCCCVFSALCEKYHNSYYHHSMWSVLNRVKWEETKAFRFENVFIASMSEKEEKTIEAVVGRNEQRDEKINRSHISLLFAASLLREKKWTNVKINKPKGKQEEILMYLYINNRIK